MQKPVIAAADAADAAALVESGATLMIGGFMVAGTPCRLIDALVDNGARDLIIIVNDTGFPGQGIGKLIASGQVRKVIASHNGTNKDTGNLMNAGALEVQLVPQGTLVEQIRAGGAGLGGFLTPTGVGTVIEQGKAKIPVNGSDYLLELSLRADVALINGATVDRSGNVVYHGTARNFNPIRPPPPPNWSFRKI
jgi:acetate CoA/acetoacetate CoA-transferase alpha subunit